MGLIKRITDNKGLAAAYWNVGYFRVDRKLKFVDCRMYGYPTRAEYEAGHDPIMVRPARCIWSDYDAFFSTEEMDAQGNNIVKCIYQYVAAKSDLFAGAEPVLEEPEV